LEKTEGDIDKIVHRRHRTKKIARVKIVYGEVVAGHAMLKFIL
jgi:hypothetical protein